jgi:hypothetical protein
MIPVFAEPLPDRTSIQWIPRVPARGRRQTLGATGHRARPEIGSNPEALP